MLDIKEYLKQTKTVLLTQDAFDELVKKASAQPERKTGRWSLRGKCSLCGGYAPFWPMASTYYESNYCPNCGAKMEVEHEP